MKIEKLEPGSWACVMFDGFKAHFCPEELVADLIADIEGRGGTVMLVEESKEGGADLPGIILANRKWVDIPLGEFKLCFPAQDFEHFMAELEGSPVRRFSNGREYHKIHGGYHCVVMTPAQRAVTLEVMSFLSAPGGIS